MQMIKTTSLKKEQKELLIFMLVTYGLTFLMGIPLAILFHAGKDLSSYPAVQMLYPASGLMLSKLICEKDNPFLPKNFFTGFLVLTGIMFLWVFAGFFLPDPIASYGNSILMVIGIIVVGILYFSEKTEKRSAYKLESKNWRLSVCLLVMFVALTLTSAFLFNLITTGNVAPEGFMEPLACTSSPQL